MKRLHKRRSVFDCEQINRKNTRYLQYQRKLSIIYRKEKHKVSKAIKNYYLSTKKIKKPKIVDIKSVITEHPKTSHKLFKTVRQAEKVGFNSSL